MISVTVDATRALNYLSDLEKQQVPFAMARAINDVAVDFQLQEFLHEKDIFTLRRPDWVQRSNKVTHFASKTELWATVTVSPPGAANRSDIIGKFEDQTTKQSVRAGGMVAVPVEARRGRTDIVVPSQRPKAFNFRQVGKRIIGDRGTYIVRRGSKQYIFQYARGGDRLLYVLVPQVPITPDLEYLRTAEWTVANKFQLRFDQRWTDALATAR